MSQTRKVTVQHVILKGDAYQIGQNQARVLRHIPGFAGFLRSGKGRFTPGQFEQISGLMQRFCPGIQEEIQGLADGLKIPVQDIVYYVHSYLLQGHCSHFALLPSRTTNQHVLVGRSYEFGDKLDDLRLCTVHVDGKFAFMGCSTLLFGFNEGMNEHGLVVTTSAGGIPVGIGTGLRPPIQDGFQFWVAVRAVLEQCRSVDEALQLLAEIPLAGNPNLIVADKTGQAALIEVYGAHQAVKRIDAASPEQFVCSTNHFSLPEMQPYNNPVMPHSLTRFQTIQTRLAAPQPLDRQALRTLLSTPYPQGLTCHYYDEFFGTLRSMVFDPQASEIDLCFGSPSANPWHCLDFDSTPGPYPAKLPLEPTPPGFWQPIV